MREVKFRGKPFDFLKHGEWVEGYLFRIWDWAYILWGTTNDVPNMIEVNPETVGQWWDLPSIKNKGVYEGDIVECGESRGVVKLSGIRLKPFGYLSGLDVGHGVKPTYTIDTQVIGNIHDNPELLEQEDK